MYLATLILGMVVLAVGAQGALRVLIDPPDAGLLAWLPGGSITQLIAYVALTIPGVAMASWGADRAREAGTLT